MMEVRNRRIEELIKIKLSSLLLRDLKDPRLNAFITVLNVKLSKDSRSARISVSVIGSDEEKKAVLRGLESARGYIQKRLNKEMRVKYIPHLIFSLDDKTEETVQLVHRLRKNLKEKPGSPRVQTNHWERAGISTPIWLPS
jgi:ribosome-binding factor A